MMKVRILGMVLAAGLLLTACVDKEERAQQHFETALELLDAGDTPRAMIELRNALTNNAVHREARQLFAAILLEEGKIQQAYGQYLLLIEQYPDIVEVRRLLAEIALDTATWEEVRRHGNEALALEPDNPANQALGIIINYHDAREQNDMLAAAGYVEQARALLKEDPNLDTALRLLIEWNATGPEPERALPYIQRLMARHPDSRSLMMAELRALDAAGDDEALGESLREMFIKLPEDEEVADLLLDWYYSRNKIAEAETFLRDRAGADDGPYERHFAVVQLLSQTQGVPAALRELDRLAEVNSGTDLGRRYATQAALVRFDTAANRDPMAIEQIINDIEDESLRNDGLLALAVVYRELDNVTRANEILETILENDPFHADALITRATDFIEAGDSNRAIVDLRTALDQSPRNTRVLLLLAEAQQRLGNIELAEQRLAQAVEVSGSDPETALLFARFQIARGKLRAAERVLRESVALNINNMETATLLAKLQLQLGDTRSAQALLQRLVESENPEAAPLIRSLQATLLFNSNRVDESLDFLRNSLDEDGDGTDDLGAELQILRIQMLSGRYEDAQTSLDSLQQRFPDATALRVIQGNLLSLQGDIDGAIQMFRTLLDEETNQLVIIQRLYALLRQAGQNEEASAILVAALENQPDSEPLILLRALELEQEGNIEAAIASYERLYADNPRNLTVANNYASMLAYYRDDPDSLALAGEVAAPLSGSTVPAFLDTMGYILLRQGAFEEAVQSFEAAARGLPGNATVAFNMARAYAAVGRTDEARAEFERGFRLAEGAGPVPKIAEARAAYDALVAEQPQEL